MKEKKKKNSRRSDGLNHDAVAYAIPMPYKEGRRVTSGVVSDLPFPILPTSLAVVGAVMGPEEAVASAPLPRAVVPVMSCPSGLCPGVVRAHQASS